VTPALALATTDGTDDPIPPETPGKPEKPDYVGPSAGGNKGGRLFSADTRYSGLFAFGGTRDVGGQQTVFTMVVDNGQMLTRNFVAEVHLFSTQHSRVAQYAAGPQGLLRVPLGKQLTFLTGGGASLFVHSERNAFDDVLFARAGFHATARLVVKIAVAGAQYQVVPHFHGQTLKQWTFFAGLGVSGRGHK
jgi:hypothetical protein